MHGFSFRSIGRSGCLAALAAALAMGSLAGGTLVLPKEQAADAAVISTTVRQRLSSYGDWKISRRFGEVWVPSVAVDWRPYTDGRWIWTDDGWYWQSAEPFGAIVFHYGRWVDDADLGWVWVAGDDWAPAWVVWRESDDDIGWAPAPPPDVTVAVTDAWWAFAPVAAIGAVNVLSDVRPIRENVTIIHDTTIINDTTIVNNYGTRQRVHIGNAIVPVNAGPALARLPKPVLASVKAAKVIAPPKGRVLNARLDTATGAAIKQSAVRREAANQPTEARSAQAGPRTVQSAEKPARTASAVVMAKKPLLDRGPPAHANKRMAKAGAAELVQNREMAKRPQPDRMRIAERTVKHPTHNVQIARLNRREMGMPHRPPHAPVARRKPASCGPHGPHCGRHA